MPTINMKPTTIYLTAIDVSLLLLLLLVRIDVSDTHMI